MATLVTTPTTILEAVNLMLASIGESPVDSVENSGVVDAATALKILSWANREVQAKGWHFNTEKAYPLALSSPDKHLILPANTMRVDSVEEDGCTDVVERGSKLYDRTKHTYVFEKSLKVDLVLLLSFEELPEYARQYIVVKAARKFQDGAVGSGTLHDFTERDELWAKAAFLNAEAESADHNILTGNYTVARILDR